MFEKAFVKPAFHMSWFVLILGGASLLERGGWSIPGAAMLLYGLFVFGYTAFAIYLKKPLLKKPAILLVISMAFCLILITAHVIFGHLILALTLSVLCIPVLVGYFRIPKTSKKSKKI